MDRGIGYFGLLAIGGILLWLVMRRRSGTRGRMALITTAIAVAITYVLLFQMM